MNNGKSKAMKEQFKEKVLMDLVCGMELDKDSEYTYIHKGKEYHFCSQHCKEHFENDPEKYIGV